MRYFWYFDANKFTVVDETGTVLPNTVTVSVKYQQRAVDPIKSTEEMGKPFLYGMAKWEVYRGVFSSYYITTKPIPIPAASGTPPAILATIPVGERLYANAERELCRLVDYENNAGGYELITTLYPTADPNHKLASCLMLETELWEHQDDGYDSDVQLTAAYYAASMLADMVPDGGQLVKSLFDRYRYRFKDLQIKHNAARYVGITIKPNQF